MVSESTAPGLNLQSGCNRVAFRFQVSGHRPLIQRATMPAKCLRAPMLGSFANSRPIGASFAQRSNAGVPKAGLKVMKVMGPKCGLKVERMVSYRCRENTNDADIVKDRNMGIVHPEPAPVLQSTGTCNHFPDTASIWSLCNAAEKLSSHHQLFEALSESKAKKKKRARVRAAVEHMQADLAARLRQVNMCCDLARSRMASISVMSDVFAAIAEMGRLSEEVRVAVAELLPLNDCAR
jgi:hypothetical protein